MEWLLEIALTVLLAATLFHALRLERALGVLKRDRAALEALVETFNASTRMAEDGIERLRAAADGAGRQVANQNEAAASLKEDLLFLIERGERIADTLDAAVRAAKNVTPDAACEPFFATAAAAEPGEPPPRVRSQAERDLLRALRIGR